MLRKYDAYLVGYYGMQNVGDDALLLASLYGAQTELNCQHFAVASASEFNSASFGQIKPTQKAQQRFKGENRASHYYYALRSKRVIFGGGSVFHNATDINLKRKLIKLAGPHSSLAVGVGLGPFADLEAEKACSAFLNECDFIGVRDAKSYEIGKRIAPEANLHMTFDLAPSLCLHPHFSVSESERKGILFNLCPAPTDCYGTLNKTQENQRFWDICQVIYRTWLQTKQPITLLDLNGQEGSDGDISELIQLKLGNKIPLDVLKYNSDPFAVINTISRYKAIVSMRLHGCILGYLAGTPALALNYHNKCVEWCQQIGMPERYQFDANRLDPQALSRALYDGCRFGFESPQLPIKDAIQYSLNNWRNHYEHAQSIRHHSPVQQSRSYTG